MKRKKLQEFTNWLANSKRRFLMSQRCNCIAGQAEHFFKGKPKDADSDTLVAAFNLPITTARELYSGYGGGIDAEGKPGQVRRCAVEVLRWLLKTDKVDWNRARKKVGLPIHPKW